MFRALPIEMVGQWWIPDNEQKARGVLRINEKGQTVLSFDDPTIPGWLPSHIPIDPAVSATKVEAVHGDVAGRPISLLDCQVSVICPDGVAIEVIADSVINGLFVANVDETAFSSVSIELEHLTAWSCNNILRDANPGDTPPPPAVIVDSPAAITAPTEQGTVELEWKVERKGIGTTAGVTRTLRESTRFVVSNRSRFSAKTARAEARRYQDLITLAAGRAAGILSVRLLGEADRCQRQFTTGTADYFFPTIVESSRNVKPITCQQMIFSLNNVDFNELIAQWPRVQETFSGAVTALLGFRYSPDQYIENQVVLLMAAVEQAHRALLEEKLISRSQRQDVQRIVRDALEGTSFGSHARTIAGKIDDRKTLDERVTELADHLGIMDSVFGGSDNFRLWLDATKKNRNLLAHTGAPREQEILKLRAIVCGAEALVELAILKGLDLGEQRLSDAASMRHSNVKRWIETEIANSHPG